MTKVVSSKSTKYRPINGVKFVYNLIRDLIWDQRCVPIVCGILFLVEIIINAIVVQRVKYTEIDWLTYMQQVECFLNGEFNYSRIEGDTGPIVYPAGHVAAYTIFYFLTDHGRNIRLGQITFIFLYLINLLFVFRIYYKTQKVPPFVLAMMCLTSYRIHSLFSLRLFNDPIAMCLLYASINFLISSHWTLGSIFFSLAVSIKMNILLFAPGLLLVFLENLNLLDTLKNLFTSALMQIIIGLPFLATYPLDYIKNSFNLKRVFLHKWTVNWRFMPENIFVNPIFHLTLLGLHLTMLMVFFGKRYWNVLLSNRGSMKSKKIIKKSTNNQSIVLTLFTSNFIGLCFARSLHYQFYVWYYHSIPFLLWTTSYSILFRLLIWGLMELCWYVYPSTTLSSITLHIMHLLLLYGLGKNNNNSVRSSKTASHKKM